MAFAHGFVFVSGANDECNDVESAQYAGSGFVMKTNASRGWKCPEKGNPFDFVKIIMLTPER